MPTLREMKEQYNSLKKEMQEVLVKSEMEKRDLTPEESAKWDSMDADISVLEKSIERRERMEALDKDLVKTAGVSLNDANARQVISGEELKKKETGAFEKWFRHGFHSLNPEERGILSRKQARVYDMADLREEMGSEYRDQSTSGSAGGYMIPQGFSNEFEKRLALYGGVRAVARAFPTPTGNDIPWPTCDDTSNVGELLAENNAAGSQDVTFGQVTLKAYKFSSKLVKVSKELLQDSYFSIDNILADLFRDRIGRITNQYFTTGTGSSQPKGVTAEAGLGKTATSGQTTTVIYDDLVDLEHSVDPDYRPNAKWMFADSTLKLLKKLKDSSGRPLWQGYAEAGFGQQVAQPTVLGYGYQINQDMPAVGHGGSPDAGYKSIVFGDFSKYIVRDVLQMELIRLDERYAEYGQVGFLMFMRTDGRAIQSNALKYFTNPTS